MLSVLNKCKTPLGRIRGRRFDFRQIAVGMLALCCLLSSGCGQVLIRQDGCSSCASPGIGEPCQQACGAERLALMKAKLGWHGDRMKDHVGQYSGKVTECWYSTHLAQWIEKKRDEANAPPPPKFHPIPTHPALFPEPTDSQCASDIVNTPID